MYIQANFKEAVQDARNMASLFYKMKSGMDAWHMIFIALETKYDPFLSDIFRDEFYSEIGKHPNFDELENEVWGGS